MPPPKKVEWRSVSVTATHGPEWEVTIWIETDQECPFQSILDYFLNLHQIAQDGPRIDSEVQTTPTTKNQTERFLSQSEWAGAYMEGLNQGMKLAHLIADWLPGQLRRQANDHLLSLYTIEKEKHG